MPSQLDTIPGLIESLSELLVAGLTYEEVSAQLASNPHVDTIRRWIKDPRVQGHMERLNRERTNRVVRKLDKVLEDRVNDPEELRTMDVSDLVKLRRELLGPAPQRIIASRGADEAEAMADLMRFLSEHPDVAEALMGAPAPAGELEPGEPDD